MILVDATVVSKQCKEMGKRSYRIVIVLGVLGVLPKEEIQNFCLFLMLFGGILRIGWVPFKRFKYDLY